jgi:hypothetical protein
MAEVEEVRWSYWIDPCGLNGQPLNNGMSYANADTAEGARAFAERWLAPGSMLGSVQVDGHEVRMGYGGWEPLPGGRTDSFTVTRAEMGLPPLFLTRETRCWDTTVLDRPERVHAMMTDGSCQCGDPQAGYGGQRS